LDEHVISGNLRKILYHPNGEAEQVNKWFFKFISSTTGP